MFLKQKNEFCYDYIVTERSKLSMHNESQNPYLMARLYANMTREQAAMKINCSVSSIKEYELGRTVPNEIVLEMAKVYRTPWLRVQHLEYNVVFCDIFGLEPKTFTNVAMNVLKVQSSLCYVSKVMPKIIENTISKTVDTCLVKSCVDLMNSLLVYICSCGNDIKIEKPSIINRRLL